MNTDKTIKPTESELEILSILWDLEIATVRMVHEKLCEHKDSGYTTTLKLMQIMHEKKLVTRDESNKTHIYIPAVSKENTQNQFLHRMIENLFSGSSAELVLQALGQQKTSKEELLKIEALINTLKSKQ
jgi:predicted transcriptional regulator